MLCTLLYNNVFRTNGFLDLVTGQHLVSTAKLMHRFIQLRINNIILIPKHGFLNI